MKFILTGLGVLIIFIVFGVLLATALPFALHPGLVAGRYFGSAAVGALEGFVAYLIWLGFLPLKPSFPPPRLGVTQSVFGLVGFILMQGLGGGLFVLLAITVLLGSGMATSPTGSIHPTGSIDFAMNNPGMLGGSVLTGEVFVTLWVYAFLRWLGPACVHDGTATGIGLRAAQRSAYLQAFLAALILIGVVVALLYIFPPDTSRVQTLALSRMFSGPAYVVAALLGMFILLGPLLEEIVFRGIIFAGLATRAGPIWAGVITTLLFIAVHAPEKLSYPPGFFDVGLLATACVLLRLKAGSIKPGIMLHILYNGGTVLATGLIH